MKPVVLFVVSTYACLASVPSIVSVTNAAIPSLDVPGYTNLAPRSLATIWGTNLADGVASTSPPWKNVLGGVEVHIVVGAFTPCGTANPPATLACEVVADMSYVSPTQINFVVPEIFSQAYVRIVLIRDDQRYDMFGCNSQTCVGGPGVFGITNGGGILFIGGYDCLFSLSLTDPSACGFSRSSGGGKVAIGAVTDLSGNLITSQNPVHEGQAVTLWMTGLAGLSKSAATGLLQEANPTAIGFGVSQPGVDTLAWGSQTPIWAGESPQYIGLDQINVSFPTPACLHKVTAVAEKRYDAYMAFLSPESVTNSVIKIYIPFLVRPGDLDCQQ
jgi:uncharacterized protein (TIGR03437 family)